jgi:uncharacterized protein (TIGR00288 family)
MPEHQKTADRVAVLVDCDNTSPDILDYALRMGARFGQVVVRQGYGNHTTLANKWQDALVRLAFTPCLQYQYAAGKNTADIALALDALELMFDDKVSTFCIVTSDSDFTYLCRKLRRRGSTVCIVGEARTPDALRNASDQFFEYAAQQQEKPKSEAPKVVKQQPQAVAAAVSRLAGATAEGWVGLSALGQELRRTDPGFSPQRHGHTRMLDMVKAYPNLVIRLDKGGPWVRPKPKNEAMKEAQECPTPA